MSSKLKLYFFNSKTAFVSGILLFIFFIFFFTPRTDDIWWRLYWGKQIVKTHELPRKNALSYKYSGHKWIDHAWGYDVLVYSLHKSEGKLKNVHFLHILLLSLVVIFILLVRKNMFSAVLAVFLMLAHYADRPYVISDYMFLIMLFLWFLPDKTQFEQKLSLKTSVKSFFFFAFWFNLHGFAFIGLSVWAILNFYLFNKFKISFKKLPYLIFPLFSVFATPYGIEIFNLFSNYSLNGYIFISELEEWKSPALWQTGALIIITFSSFFSSEARQFLKNNKFLVIVSFIFFLSALWHRRYIPAFLIFISVLSFRISAENGFMSLITGIHKAVNHKIVFLFSAFFFVFLSINTYFHYSDDIKSRFYPVKAYSALGRRLKNVRIKVFTLHAWSGSLIWHFNGQFKPFIDARNDCYPSEAFRIYDKIINLKPGWYKSFKNIIPDIVILPAAHPLALELVKKGWNGYFLSKNVKLLLKHTSD